jgi:hypothetical protein
LSYVKILQELHAVFVDGTAETVTFCLSGTGMLYGSGSGSVFRYGSNIKCNKEVEK